MPLPVPSEKMTPVTYPLVKDHTMNGFEKTSSVTAESRAPRKPSTTTRHARISGKWTDALRRADVGQLWNELHRLVCFHPLVRASWSAGLLVESDTSGARGTAYRDMTQELFVVLLGKDRFQHYMDTGMTDSEIECEIGQIELTNLLTAELRKRHPESYRLARRISTVIQSSANFKRFDTPEIIEDETMPEYDAEPREIEHRRLADRIYGLREWAHAKPRRNHQEMEQRTGLIPVRARDTRLVGCTGDAQVIINNSDLEDLIISVLEAIDAPTDVRALRSLVMSRLPVMDIYLVPLGGTDDGDETRRTFEPVDAGETPEEGLLRRESESEAGGIVDEFLRDLHTSVRGKSKQFDRMVHVLWYCYLSPDHITQLDAAARLGVSDSLVSDYRRRIEASLRALSFVEVEEARRFEHALRERVCTLAAVTVNDAVGATA